MKKILSLVPAVLAFCFLFITASCLETVSDSLGNITATQLEGMWLTTSTNSEFIEPVNAYVYSFSSDSTVHKYGFDEDTFADFGPFTVSYQDDRMILTGENVRYVYQVAYFSPKSITIKLISKEVNGEVNTVSKPERVHLARINKEYSSDDICGIWTDNINPDTGLSDARIFKMGADGIMTTTFDKGPANTSKEYRVFGNLVLLLDGEQRSGFVIDTITTIHNQTLIRYYSQSTNNNKLYGTCRKLTDENFGFDATDLYGGYWVGSARNGQVLAPKDRFIFKYNPDGTEFYATWDPSKRQWIEDTYFFEFQKDRMRYSKEPWSATHMLYYLDDKYMIDSNKNDSYCFNIKTTKDYSSAIVGIWLMEDRDEHLFFEPNGMLAKCRLDPLINLWIAQIVGKYTIQYGNCLILDSSLEYLDMLYFIEIDNDILYFDPLQDRSNKVIRKATSLLP